MLRFALAIALGFSVITLAGVTTNAAEDAKKEETKVTKLEGKLVCTKCKLSETESCGNALQVKDGEKVVTYYLQDKGKGEKYHKCAGEQAATVTGKVGKDKEDPKKLIITDAKVEKTK